jgi:hypothetical protein
MMNDCDASCARNGVQDTDIQLYAPSSSIEFAGARAEGDDVYEIGVTGASEHLQFHGAGRGQ